MSYSEILQGKFTSGGVNKFLPFPTGVDWVEVINYTQAGTQNATGRGTEFKWQRGMATDTGVEYKKTNNTDALNMVTLASGGFTLYDSTINAPGVLNNGSTGITNVSAANPPVVTVGSTAGMSAGNIVRLYNMVGAQQLASFDFTIGYGTFTATTFSLDYMSAVAAAAAPGASAAFRVIPYYPMFYPSTRYITKITKATQAVVSLSVTHQYQIGQVVRFVIPDQFGMVELNNLKGTIVDINDATTAVTGNTITVDIDTTAFTTFAWPVTSVVPFSAAMTVPIGQDTAESLDANVPISSDAMVNLATTGIILAAGAQSPAGSLNDVIYWKAGVSFSVDNQ